MIQPLMIKADFVFNSFTLTITDFHNFRGFVEIYQLNCNS